MTQEEVKVGSPTKEAKVEHVYNCNNADILQTLCDLGHHVGDGHRQIIQKLGDGDQTISQLIGDTGQRLTSQICNTGQHVVDQVNATGSRVSLQVGDFARDLSRQVSDVGCTIVGAVNASERGISDRVDRGFIETQRGQTEGVKELLIQGAANTKNLVESVKDGFKDVLLKSCNDTTEIRHDVQSGFKDALLKDCENTGLVLRTMDKETSEISKGMVIGFKDQLLTNFQHKEALAKQLAECCCELKELMREDGEKTRALVREIDQRRCDRELTDAKAEILFLKGCARNGPGNS